MGFFAFERLLLADMVTGNDDFTETASDPKKEVLVADPYDGTVTLWDASDGGQFLIVPSEFTFGDAIAAGQLEREGKESYAVAGDITHRVDVFSRAGGDPLIALDRSFPSAFTGGDGFAVGDVTGSGTAEVVVGVEDLFSPDTGRVVVYRRGGQQLAAFDVGYRAADALAVRQSFPDRDGDGIRDEWEISGIDIDDDGLTDVDLPSMGADPDHKDLFVELDWMGGFEPTADWVAAVKHAFAVAPVEAGGLRIQTAFRASTSGSTPARSPMSPVRWGTTSGGATR